MTFLLDWAWKSTPKWPLKCLNPSIGLKFLMVFNFQFWGLLEALPNFGVDKKKSGRHQGSFFDHTSWFNLCTSTTTNFLGNRFFIWSTVSNSSIYFGNKYNCLRICLTVGGFLGDILYVLVGQEGESACVHNGVETREGLCSKMVNYLYYSNKISIYYIIYYNFSRIKEWMIR